MAVKSPETFLTASAMSKTQDSNIASSLNLQIAPIHPTQKTQTHNHHHRYQDQHIDHHTHKHMHNSISTESSTCGISIGGSNDSRLSSEQPASSSFRSDMHSITGDGRGRSRIIRPGGRSSSTESSSSTNSSNQDAMASQTVIKLIQQYKDTGDSRELARIAREPGIPDSLRLIVWPILLQNHPFVKEKSLVKEYRHSEDSYTPRDIPVKRIRAEIDRYHRKKNKTPTTRTGTPPSSASPSMPTNEGGAPISLPTDPVALDNLALDTAVEEAVVAFLQKHDGITYARGMVYVCFALAECIFTPPSRIQGVNAELANFGVDPVPSNQTEVLVRCFEQIMCIMLWSPTALAPTDRMEGITEQRISTFLTECRQLIPELCGILDEEETLGFEEEWVQSWVQWWGAKEIGRLQRSRLWDWYLGFQKPDLLPGTFGKPKPDEGFKEAFSPSDWHILVCIALLNCLHDHMDDLEQSEIRSLLSNIPDRQIGSMSKIIEVAKGFRRKLRDLRAKEDAEYAANNSALAQNP